MVSCDNSPPRGAEGLGKFISGNRSAAIQTKSEVPHTWSFLFKKIIISDL